MNMIYVVPAQRDYAVVSGNTFSDAFTVKLNSSPVDLTGWKARLQGRRDADDAVPVIDLSTTNGAIVLGGTAGTVNVMAAAAMVRSWGRVAVHYQFEFEDAAGAVQTFYYGEFVVGAEWAK